MARWTTLIFLKKSLRSGKSGCSDWPGIGYMPVPMICRRPEDHIFQLKGEGKGETSWAVQYNKLYIPKLS